MLSFGRFECTYKNMYTFKCKKIKWQFIIVTYDEFCVFVTPTE